MVWAHGCNGGAGDKECLQSIGEEISLETPTWKTEKRYG
jgi:hypothetical protein